MNGFCILNKNNIVILHFLKEDIQDFFSFSKRRYLGFNKFRNLKKTIQL